MLHILNSFTWRRPLLSPALSHRSSPLVSPQQRLILSSVFNLTYLPLQPHRIVCEVQFLFLAGFLPEVASFECHDGRVLFVSHFEREEAQSEELFVWTFALHVGDGCRGEVGQVAGGFVELLVSHGALEGRIGSWELKRRLEALLGRGLYVLIQSCIMFLVLSPTRRAKRREMCWRLAKVGAKMWLHIKFFCITSVQIWTSKRLQHTIVNFEQLLWRRKTILRLSI